MDNRIIPKVDNIKMDSFNLRNSNKDLFSIKIRAGRPRIVIDYAIPDNVDKSKVEYKDRQLIAPFNYTDFLLFLSGVEMVLSGSADSYSTISKYDIDKEGKRLPEAINKARVLIRKRENTKVFELVITNYFKDNKETVFVLESDPEWFVIEVNNITIPNSMFSETYAKNYFKTLNKALDIILEENMVRYDTVPLTAPPVLNQPAPIAPPPENKPSTNYNNTTSSGYVIKTPFVTAVAPLEKLKEEEIPF